jgi:hypothetical protein
VKEFPASVGDIVSMPGVGRTPPGWTGGCRPTGSNTLDRDDVDDLKRKAVRSLDRGGRRRLIGTYERFARMALDQLADVPSPKIFDLGCGLGGLFSLHLCQAVRRTS